MKQLSWYVINKDYVTYLKRFDSRVENIDYGENTEAVNLPPCFAFAQAKGLKFYVILVLVITSRPAPVWLQ